MSLKTDTRTGLVDVISCHSFNANHTRVALCPNNNEMVVYDCSKGPDTKTWTRVAAVSEHSSLISDIDWCSSNGYIVTCGHDRNAYVWKEVAGEWKPTLCVLRIGRAAISTRWSPNGLKFAVASGHKCIPVCSYEASSDWWTSKMIRKHKSSVVCVAWSPNSRFLVTASTDYNCRIVSAYDKRLDSVDSDYDAIFGEDQYDHGEVLAEYNPSNAWINTCAWSPCGYKIAFFGHDSTAHFVDLRADKNAVQTIYLSGLPMLSCEFLAADILVAAGFDNNPAFFKYDGSKWNFVCYADKAGDNQAEEKKVSATSKAFAMFQQADSQGRKFGSEVAKKNITKHKNTINCVRKADGLKFTTSGLDGNVFFWDAAKYI